MSGLTDTEAVALLTTWASHHAATQQLTNDVQALFYHAPESPFGNTVWKLFSAYTNALARLLCDTGAPRDENWLQWYWLENDMGDSGLQAGYNSNMRCIATLEDLYALIKEGRST